MRPKLLPAIVILKVSIALLDLLFAYSGHLLLINQTSSERRIVVLGDVEISRGWRSCTYWTGLRLRTFQAEADRWNDTQCPLIAAPGRALINGSDIIID